jgi:ATP-dependent helicase/nuclease subunit A
VAALWRPFQATVAADPALRADYAAVAAEHGRAQTQKALAAALSRRTEFVLADEAGVVEASVPPFSALWPELADLAAPADALRGDAARQRWLAWAAELGRESGKTAPKAPTRWPTPGRWTMPRRACAFCARPSSWPTKTG